VTSGFGTGPDTILLPEPGVPPMVATARAVALGWLARRRLCQMPPAARSASASPLSNPRAGDIHHCPSFLSA